MPVTDTAKPESLPDPDELLSLLWQQSLDHAFVLTDADGVIVGWRGAAERLLGFTEQEAVGQPISMIFTEDDVSRGAPELERSIAQTAGYSEDDRWHMRRDGTRIWVTGTLTSLRSRGGFAGFAKVMRDRTDLRMAIEQVRNRLDSLEMSSVSRDAAFARIAHELRNAVGPMSNAVDLLGLVEDRSDSNRFAVALLNRQLDMMRRLLADLANAAQVRAGKIHLALRSIDLASEISEICRTVANRTEARRQKLVVLVPPRPMPIRADPQRLHQIVFNLLDNAIKYTPEGGNIRVKLTDESGCAVLRVQDDGVGIAPAMLPVIFDLFTQERGDDNDQSAGFGVGLTIVRDLVAAHGGTTEARSEGKGKGSEFTVRLPFESA